MAMTEETLKRLSDLSLVRFNLREFQKMRRGTFRGFYRCGTATLLIRYNLIVKNRRRGSGRVSLTNYGLSLLEMVEEEQRWEATE